MNEKSEAQLLIDKVTKTFYDYDNETMYVGILDFMMLLIDAAKLIDKQEKEILSLKDDIYNDKWRYS